MRLFNRNIGSLFIALSIFILSLNAQDKVKQIDELVQKYYELGQINGSVLVAEGGNIIYSKGIGFADIENKIANKPDTKFRLASVTKQFTATLVMQLVEKGKIKLDGKLSDYLTYYRKDIGDKITIHQILSHTSGIANYTDDAKFMQDEVKNKVAPRDFVLKYCSGELVFEPGTSWAYSNSGYFILGAVIEEVTGKTYETVLKENILGPLGMTNSGYEHNDIAYENYAKGYTNLLGEYMPARFLEMTIPYSAGALYSTVEDMFKWDQALYGNTILSDESKEKMFTPVQNNYGYGWGIIEQPVGDVKVKVITHSGGIFGFNSLITRLVEDKKFVMVLNNFENGNISTLTKGIINILYGLEASPPKQSLAIILLKAIKEKGVAEGINEYKALKEDKTNYVVSENDMNNLGYLLLQQGKVKEAIEVFKLNVEAFPESFNVYDSLGEAYMTAGDNENAIINYKKSIELNPNNDGGKKMLEKLEKK